MNRDIGESLPKKKGRTFQEKSKDSGMKALVQRTEVHGKELEVVGLLER